MIIRSEGRGLLVASTVFLTSCLAVPRPAPVEPAAAAAPAATMAAKHEPASPAQARIVIPEDWRKRHPFSQRFPELQAESGRHVIDLAAMRFETDDLVSVSSNGQRVHAMPDLSTFARELDTLPFLTTGKDYFIVQAKSAADQSALRAWLESNEIPILDYIPQLAYLVRASQEDRALLEQRPEVFWAGQYSPAFRVDPLLDFIIDENPAQKIQLRALFDVDSEKEVKLLLDRLAALGLSDPQATRRARDWSIRVEGTAVSARSIALLPGCLWVERYVAPHVSNNTARSSANIVTGRGALNGPIMDVENVWARGIRGEGQIASASDTGLSTGTLATLHHDFGQQGSGTNPLRVLACYALGRIGNCNDDQTTGGGHGTHTSGSIVGNGFRSGSSPSTNSFPSTSYAGTAPKAQFVFQSIMDSGGGLGGIPGDLSTLFQQAYNDGARVHSNSWGSDTNGQYTILSQEVDQFTWLHKDMVITYSAGNSGRDTISPGPIDGIINLDSMGAPATAKNCIAVGASENYLPSFVYEFPAGDCTSSNGIEQKTWGWFNNTNFGTAPISTDLMADNANGMGAFSSRGPTDDGRFKPDLVAPGIAITSTRTDVNQAYDHWGVCAIPAGFRPYYTTQGGTSMANPLTAGAATLVRQYYADGWHANNSTVTNVSPVPAQGFNPSAALVKATLINGAWDMSPGQYGTGATKEIPAAWDTGKTLPNNTEGFGRVDVEKSLFPGSGFQDAAGKRLKVHDVTSGLQTGGSSNFTFDVGGNGDPLIVTLVWTDPQAATGAGTKLVNNLDLTVTAPGGATTYFPNGVDKTSGADTLNNVEQVKVTSPLTGLWTITVAGTNVPGNAESGSNTQPFALVISGESCTTAPSVPGGVNATASGPNRITVTWTASTGSPVSYKVYRAGPGASCPVSGYSLLATVSAPTVTYDDFTASGGGTYSYKVTSVGSCESALSACDSATATGACTLPPAFAGLASVTPPNAATCTLALAWAAASGSCSGPVTYNVYRSTSAGFTPSPANRIALGLIAVAYTDVNVSAGTTYYYNVRAVENGVEEGNTVQQSGTAGGLLTEAYFEDFDGLADGNLAGFTLSGTGTADWRGVMACSPNQSAGKVFRFGGAGCTANYQDNAAALAVINGATGIVVPAGATKGRLDFWHRLAFEGGFDGGVIRIRRLGDAGFTYVPTSAILLGNYNASAFGQAVWGGTFNAAMTNSIIDLDAACNAIAGNTNGCAGKTLFIAFTALTDSSIVYPGWSIDDVKITYETPCVACTPPGAPTGLALTAPAANTVHLAWSSGAPAGVSYNIYRETGACPMGSTPVRIATGVTGTSFDDTGVAGGTTYRYIVRAVSVAGCESGSSACQSIGASGPSLAPPPNLTATATGTSAVIVTWGSVAGAANYIVERSLDNSAFTTIGTTTGSSIVDGGRTANTSYLYRAQARNGGGTLSNKSNKDAATTIIYADTPLVAGTSPVEAVHLTQLRTAINAMLDLANLSPATFTDPTLTAATTIMKRLHVTELRTNLDAARLALGLPTLTYTDPSITEDVTVVKASHIEQLRNGTK
ncbi:MAG TPA: S8 family serine peptidase [Thermoanaerobaculia bacterium]|nr:S8 family serine peptidase [Thermoanaerobaculia bacterium]